MRASGAPRQWWDAVADVEMPAPRPIDVERQPGRVVVTITVGGCECR